VWTAQPEFVAQQFARKISAQQSEDVMPLIEVDEDFSQYKPGSPGAVECGCTCPQAENNFGRGRHREDYCAVGEVVFGFFAGQYSHTNELGVASTISSRLVLRRLKLIGREQVGHLGHGLYMAGPCAYCRRTQRAVLRKP